MELNASDIHQHCLLWLLEVGYTEPQSRTLSSALRLVETGWWTCRHSSFLLSGRLCLSKAEGTPCAASKIHRGPQSQHGDVASSDRRPPRGPSSSTLRREHHRSELLCFWQTELPCHSDPFADQTLRCPSLMPTCDVRPLPGREALSPHTSICHCNQQDDAIHRTRYALPQRETHHQLYVLSFCHRSGGGPAPGWVAANEPQPTAESSPHFVVPCTFLVVQAKGYARTPGHGFRLRCVQSVSIAG